jgi:polyisoprenoid-binding protein YceI
MTGRIMTALHAESLIGNYELDAAHTRVGFVARHAMVTKLRGQFRQFEGHAFLNLDNLASTHVELTIEAASVDTGNARRDAHLRASDFLDVAAHPKITFASTTIVKVFSSGYRMLGDLSVKAVSRPVVIDFEFMRAVKDSIGYTRMGFEGKTTINRREWGVAWSAPIEAGGVPVSDKLTLEFDVSAIQVDTVDYV